MGGGETKKHIEKLEAINDNEMNQIAVRKSLYTTLKVLLSQISTN